eukprot:TRINITY_DN1715_c0_g6_i1.p1 TRINITY_DN1715_c0_g6~~TRINITY_DN1715_c0_g6_i1.p1  ORF type:complete len:1165 (+),score=273.47 TRINITY_DN1715_c0_g6_i1:55-3549(+)
MYKGMAPRGTSAPSPVPFAGAGAGAGSSVTSVASASANAGEAAEEAPLPPPLALRGRLRLRRMEVASMPSLPKYQVRFVAVEEAHLRWWASEQEAEDMGVDGCRGFVDFAANSVVVEADPDDASKFTLKPAGGRWLSASFCGADEGRELYFDACGSLADRQQWMASLRAHASHGEVCRGLSERRRSSAAFGPGGGRLEARALRQALRSSINEEWEALRSHDDTPSSSSSPSKASPKNPGRARGDPFADAGRRTASRRSKTDGELAADVATTCRVGAFRTGRRAVTDGALTPEDAHVGVTRTKTVGAQPCEAELAHTKLLGAVKRRDGEAIREALSSCRRAGLDSASLANAMLAGVEAVASSQECDTACRGRGRPVTGGPSRQHRGADADAIELPFTSASVPVPLEAASGDNDQAVSQQRMLFLFRNRILEKGRRMKKVANVLIRPGRVGERVMTIVGGVVTSTRVVEDDSDMVVQACTADHELYVLSQEKFLANYRQPGEELDCSRDPKLRVMKERGFLRYTPKELLRFVLELDALDVARVPARRFVASWGATQPIEVGSFLAMGEDMTEVYLMPRDVLIQYEEVVAASPFVPFVFDMKDIKKATGSPTSPLQPRAARIKSGGVSEAAGESELPLSPSSSANAAKCQTFLEESDSDDASASPPKFKQAKAPKQQTEMPIASKQKAKREGGGRAGAGAKLTSKLSPHSPRSPRSPRPRLAGQTTKLSPPAKPSSAKSRLGSFSQSEEDGEEARTEPEAELPAGSGAEAEPESEFNSPVHQRRRSLETPFYEQHTWSDHEDAQNSSCAGEGDAEQEEDVDEEEEEEEEEYDEGCEEEEEELLEDEEEEEEADDEEVEEQEAAASPRAIAARPETPKIVFHLAPWPQEKQESKTQHFSIGTPDFPSTGFNFDEVESSPTHDSPLSVTSKEMLQSSSGSVSGSSSTAAGESLWSCSSSSNASASLRLPRAALTAHGRSPRALATLASPRRLGDSAGGGATPRGGAPTTPRTPQEKKAEAKSLLAGMFGSSDGQATPVGRTLSASPRHRRLDSSAKEQRALGRAASARRAPVSPTASTDAGNSGSLTPAAKFLAAMLDGPPSFGLEGKTGGAAWSDRETTQAQATTPPVQAQAQSKPQAPTTPRTPRASSPDPLRRPLCPLNGSMPWLP